MTIREMDVLFVYGKALGSVLSQNKGPRAMW